MADETCVHVFLSWKLSAITANILFVCFWSAFLQKSVGARKLGRPHAQHIFKVRIWTRTWNFTKPEKAEFYPSGGTAPKASRALGVSGTRRIEPQSWWKAAKRMKSPVPASCHIVLSPSQWEAQRLLYKEEKGVFRTWTESSSNKWRNEPKMVSPRNCRFILTSGSHPTV